MHIAGIWGYSLVSNKSVCCSREAGTRPNQNSKSHALQAGINFVTNQLSFSLKFFFFTFYVFTTKT